MRGELQKSGVIVDARPPITIQAKLTVNAPGDVYEHEAERIAEHAMRMPESQGPAGVTQVSHPPREQHHLQTRNVGSSNSGKTVVPAVVHEVLASPGQALDTTTRAFAEKRLGQDFGHVRIHTDAKAAQSARSIRALAFTAGHDVTFAAGQFAPQTVQGKKLLLHELTHVMQQGSAGQGQQVAPVESGAEDGRVNLRQASQGSVPQVQRFTEPGHKLIGDEAFGTELLTLGPGLQVTYGDAVAMGDYFGSFKQMKNLAEKPGKGPGTQGEVWYVLLVKIRKEEVGDWMNKRYDKYAVHVRDQAANSLDARNISHFSNPLAGDTSLVPLQKNQRKEGNRPFGAAATYRQGHEEAMALAYDHGIKGEAMVDATLADAFACHFLTDSFSASHVRTPRASMKEHWDKLIPKFQQKLIQWLADEVDSKHWSFSVLDQAPVIGYLGVKRPLAYLTGGSIRTQTVEQLSILLSPPDQLSFGNVVSLIIHDIEGAATVDATIGGAPIRLAGDLDLVTDEKDPITKRQKPSKVQGSSSAQDTFAAAVRAVKASQEDVYEAYMAGWRGEKLLDAYKKAKGTDLLYTAERLVPQPVGDSLLPANRRSLAWMQKSVDDFLAQHKTGLGIWGRGRAEEFEKRLNSMKGMQPVAINAIYQALIVPLKSGNPDKIAEVLRKIIRYK
jgi:hypothetical protein